VGGRKNAFRRLDANGVALEEAVIVGDGPAGEPETDPEAVQERSLLVSLIADGVIDERYLGVDGTRLAREHHASVMAELPIQAFRLGRGDAVVPTVYA
jgi:nicotinate phosphoribosyltransferase